MSTQNDAVRLGERLSACAAYVREGSRVADVGTDHAQLPVWLVTSGRAPSAVATDINEGPLALARRNIARLCPGADIKTLLCDGLAAVSPDEVDDVIIAGMGGDVIVHILSEAPWLRSEKYRLILQPMSKPERLRGWLAESGFEIIDETPVRDAGRLYSILCVSFTGEARQPELWELCGGALCKKTDDPLAKEYLAKSAAALGRRANGLRCEENEEEAAQYDAAAEKLEGYAK